MDLRPHHFLSLCVLLLYLGLPNAELFAQAPDELASAALDSAGESSGGSEDEGPGIVLRPTIPAYFPGCSHFPEGTADKADCSAGKLMSHISRTMVYPDAARELGIEGVVMLSFVVGDTGRVREVRILRDIGGGCAAEAQRVMESMPLWEPALFKGRQVATQFTLPITFGLRKGLFDYVLHIGGEEGAELLDGEIYREEVIDFFTGDPLRVTDPRGTELPITEVVYTFERGGERQQLVTRGDELLDKRRLSKFIGRKPGRLTVEANVAEGMDVKTITRNFVIVR